jgi:hypothetical protein
MTFDLIALLLIAVLWHRAGVWRRRERLGRDKAREAVRDAHELIAELAHEVSTLRSGVFKQDCDDDEILDAEFLVER